MQSQMQCPVCTLFLHVGMNLQVHLDTHPKDQVIQALVNLTVTQQQTNDSDLNTMRCSRYAPLLDEPVVSPHKHSTDVHSKSSIGFYPEPRHQQQEIPTQPLPPTSSRNHQQVVIVNSCSTSVFREGSSHPSSSTSAQQIITNRIPITCDTVQKTNEIAENPPLASKPSSIINLTSAHLTPPPPYDYVPHIHRQYYNRNKQITTEIKNNEPLKLLTSHLAEDLAIGESQKDDNLSAIHHNSSENISDENHLSEDVDVCFLDDFDSQECAETMKIDVDDDADYHQSRPSSAILLNDDDDVVNENHDQPVRPNSVIHFNDYHYGNDDPVLQSSATKSVAPFPMPIQIHNTNTVHTTSMQPLHPIVSGRRKSSFRILSNVKLDPIYDVFREYKLATKAPAANIVAKDEPKEEVFDLDATNGTMSLKQTANDSIDDRHSDMEAEVFYATVTMVPAALSDARKSERSLPDPVGPIDQEQTVKIPTEIANSHRNLIQQQPSEIQSPHQPKPVVDVTQPLPQSVAIKSIVTPSTSRGATSVIRMASPKKKTDVAEIVSTRPLVKAPFVKATKKLVVKFKKPFVPVVEEEANLQPPDISPPSIARDRSEQQCISDDANEAIVVDESDPKDTLSCAEDFPFSPFRRSFTPVLQISVDAIGDVSAKVDNTEKVECDEQQTALNTLNANCEPPAYPAKQEVDISRPTSPPNEDEMQAGVVSDNEHLENESSIHLEDYMYDTKLKIDFNQISPSAVDAKGTAPNTEPDDNGINCSISMKTEVWSEPATIPQNVGPFELLPNSNASDLYSASTSSHPTTSTSSSSAAHSFVETPAGPSRIDYGLSSFLGYNDPGDNDDFYTGVSAIGFNTQETYSWNHRFSPQYAPFESGEKSSYMDLDMCKNTNSYGERAPSTDSLNIRTDEKMPAKGEISEQESNGDVDGSWSHQNYPMQDNLPRYTSSYDTTVARESWSLRNDQTPRDFENISMVLPKFTPLDTTFPDNDDIKPPTSDLLTTAAAKLEKSKQLKLRKYRCPECPQVFAMLKEKRNHLVVAHNYEEKPWRNRIPCTATSSSEMATTSTSVSVDLAMPSTSGDLALVKHEPSAAGGREPRARMNRYLLNYNWNILRQRLASQANGGEDVKFPIPPSTSSNSYMCMVCHELFASIKAYDAHMSVHPAECYTCGRLFKHWINLNVHLKRHLNIRDYSCVHCSKKFVLRQNLLEHMNTHSGDTPLQCKFCSKRFRRYSNLIQHRNRHHLKLRPKEKDFICYCGAVFHSEAKIAWHRETHDKKPKCCPYCRERFMHRNSLSRHVRLSHTERFSTFNGETVECTICNKTYKKSSLKAHVASHTSKVEFGCNICDKGFTTKWNLKQHKWIHASRSSKPFKCTVCPKAFIREAEYTSHMNTHKSIKPYTCDHCGCQFARKYNWLRHTREHEKPKGFRCNDCGKVFHRAYYLTEHRRSHTGERPFECIICGKTSTTKTNHNKHVKIHHARDPLTAEG